MAGYSGTPLPRKLGIKEGARVALFDAPAGFATTLGELPPGARVVAAEDGQIDVIVAFVTSLVETETAFTGAKPLLAYHGGLWMAWPKKQPRQPVSITENEIREVGLAAGLVDNKVCAIDARWSGLRFVYRVADRPRV